ncbi:hypothetical protein MMC32_008320 [Xylographa parallela]|nr:hypothetical protein [Xylographa parallela]
MYGIDVEPAFSDLGYELFRDRNRLNVTFIAANLTQMSTPSLKTLQESFDIISVQNLFHLFNLEVQKTVARYLVSLIKPIAGSLIFGLQVGSTEGKEVEGLAKGTSAFAHSVETWAKFWHDIGETTNSKWHVRVHADETPEWFKRQRWGMSSMVIIVFTAVRQQWVLSSESQWYAD